MSAAFASEASLCEAFAVAARGDGWICYPEQGGWDLLLVRRGVQVGVQAKLVGCTKVLLQALPMEVENACSTHQRQLLRARWGHGPHYRSVLVGGWRGRTAHAQTEEAREFYAVARHLRLLVLEPPRPQPWVDHGQWVRHGYNENLELQFRQGRWWSHLDCRSYRWRPTKPEWVPPFVPTHAAGVPCPKVVSPWMLAAVRLEQRARERGWVALADAVEVTADVGGGWNPSTLLNRACECTGEPVGDRVRGYRWRVRRWQPPSHNYPEVARAIGLEPVPDPDEATEEQPQEG